MWRRKSSPPTSKDKDLPPDPPLTPGLILERGHNDAYSTLEVYHNQPDPRHLSECEKIANGNPYIESDKHAAPMVRRNSADGKIISYDYNSHKEALTTETEIPFPSSTEPEEIAAPGAGQPRILGLRRKTSLITLITLALVLIVVAVGGGVGGATAKHKAPTRTSASNPMNTTTTARYANTGLAALQWTDPNGTMYKRLYYQDNNNMIRESAWDNTTDTTTPWQINTISDAVKPGTPIAAAAGWPHASYNYSLVKNVYYVSTAGELTERQAPANNSQAWEDDNFTGLFTPSNDSFLTAYWGQNIYNASEELVVLFQENNFENGITQARYISENSSSDPWVANNFPFAQPKGSTFAMSLVSYRSGRHLMLYTVGDGGKVEQNEYSINTNEPVESVSVVALTSQSATPLTIDARAPLTVVAQDNQPLYTDFNITLPECYQDTPLTNLIVYATPDRSSLVLNAWNCTGGFEDHTSEIAPLQRRNTTFLALAAMSDRATGCGELYVLFDAGGGPEVEEWSVPRRAGDPWVVVRSVDVEFAV